MVNRTLADDKWQQHSPTLSRLNKEQALRPDIQPDFDGASHTVDKARQIFEVWCPECWTA